MKETTRRTITRRTACCAGWVLFGALAAGCSSSGDHADPTSSSAGAHTSATVSGTARGIRVVVSGDVPDARLREVLRDAQTAGRRVRQVWGRSVLTGTTRIDVPADEEGFRRHGGSVEPGAQIAATTTADDRVVLAPSLFTDVTSQGRVVVLTHELTHVALHQAASVDIRRWVVEGAAEFTAYRATRLGLARLAPQLAAAVRAGRVPAGPPSDARFRSAPQAAYQEAYAWCAFLVDRFGLERFTDFVRSAAPTAGADDFAATFGASVASQRGPFGAFLRARVGAETAASRPGG